MVTNEKKKASVFIAIFTQSERDGWLAPGMAQFLVATSVAAKERNISLSMSDNIKPIDYARNLIVQAFLASGFDWLLQIDNDMAPPPNLIDVLDRAEAHMKIIAPKTFHIATIRNPESGRDEGGRLVEGWLPIDADSSKSEWRELAWTGTGALFVHRQVFERMGTAGWFRFTYDGNGQRTNFEDISFCQNARRAGFSVWGNQEFVVDHFKTVSLALLASKGAAVCPTPLHDLQRKGITEEFRVPGKAAGTAKEEGL